MKFIAIDNPREVELTPRDVEPVGLPFISIFGADAYHDRTGRERLGVFAHDVQERYANATHFVLGEREERDDYYRFPVQAYRMK